MKNQRLSIFIILNFIVFTSIAQLDSNFFNLNVVNPAFVGTKDNFSAGVNYNKDFVDLDFPKFTSIGGSPKSFIANIYTPINSKIGTGISYLRYTVGPIKQSFINADVSYKFTVSENSNLSIGLKTGVSISNVDVQQLLIPDGGVGSDPLLITSDDNQTNLNLGFGVYFTNNDLAIGLSVPDFLAKNILENISSNPQDKPINIVLSTTYKFNLTEKTEFLPSGMLVLPTKGKSSYYIAGNINFKKVIGIGLNYQKDVFGIQLSSPKIANIFRVGFNIGFVKENLYVSPFDNTIDVFGNFDFNPINQSSMASK